MAGDRRRAGTSETYTKYRRVPVLPDFLGKIRIVEKRLTPTHESRFDPREVVDEPALQLLHEDGGIVEVAVDEIDGLPVKTRRPRRECLGQNLRRVAQRTQNVQLHNCANLHKAPPKYKL
jgi:hypothetical protein